MTPYIQNPNVLGIILTGTLYGLVQQVTDKIDVNGNLKDRVTAHQMVLQAARHFIDNPTERQYIDPASVIVNKREFMLLVAQTNGQIRQASAQATEDNNLMANSTFEPGKPAEELELFFNTLNTVMINVTDGTFELVTTEQQNVVAVGRVERDQAEFAAPVS